MKILELRAFPLAVGCAILVFGVANGCSDEDASTTGDVPIDGSADSGFEKEGGGASTSDARPDPDDASGTDAASDAPKPCTTPSECDDGNPCTTDACGPTGACTHALIDEDKDDAAAPTLGACGKDCHPGDGRVHPGQKQYFGAPHDGGLVDSGRPDGASFDYDCNGAEEMFDPDLFTSCKVANGVCFGSGWYTTVPKCGEQGTRAVCGINLGGCNPKSTQNVTQRCR